MRKYERGKRWIKAIGIGLLCALCFTGGKIGFARAEESKRQTLDLYVLTGEYAVGEVKAVDTTADSLAFDNVYVYGKADENIFVQPNNTAKIGFGASVSRFGAELGFAERVSTASELSLIFKYAKSEMKMESFLEKDFEEFSAMLTEAVERYESLRYDVTLRAGVWLGEGDSENLSSVIASFRNLYKDLGIEEKPLAPVLVGNTAAENQALTTMPFVYSFECAKEGGEAETLAQGRKLADRMIARVKENSVRVRTDENGWASVDYATFEEAIEVVFTGEYGYELATLTMNGEEIDLPKEGKLTLAKGRYYLYATFREKPKYTLRKDNIFARGVCEIEGEKKEYYKGEEICFTVKAAKGFSVEEVTFNGRVLTEEDGKYRAKIEACENVIAVRYKKEETAESTENEQESAKGCGAFIGGGIASGILPCIVAFVGALTMKKRRKKE